MSKKMKIVVLDGYTTNPGDLSWDGFAPFADLVIYDRTDRTEAISRIGDAEGVIVNKTNITASVMDACPNMKYIGVLAAGYDIVDVLEATKRGITVTNTPNYGSYAVGQFAFAMLLEICCHFDHHARAVKEGRWTNSRDWCFWDYPIIELAGKTMGIIGYGKIGQKTGAIAQAMGMRVLANDSYVNHSLECETMSYVDLDRLFRESDVIALHCPLFPETREIVRRETINKMKDGVIILNNSRGLLVNERDLAEALESGKVYAAGLDVVSVEPIRADNPLLKAKNCYISPHISWAAKECRMRILEIAAGNVEAFLKGIPKNKVS